jgi:hypothetical protein
MVGGDISAIVVAVSVTILAFVAIACRRAVVFERSVSATADDAAALSEPGPKARGRHATIRWVIGVIAWMALILIVDWALIFAPRTVAHEALLWANLGVSLATLGLAILLGRRLMPARLLVKRHGATTMDVDTASRGRISLGLSLAGIVIPVGGLILIVVFVGINLGGTRGPNPVIADYGIFLCILVFAILELLALGAGIASRRTATGIAGLLISGVLVLLSSVSVFVLLSDAVEEGYDTGPILKLCPIVISAATLVFLSIATRRVAVFERTRGVISATASSASGPAARNGRMTTGRLMGGVLGTVLALGLFAVPLYSDPDLHWFTEGGFLLVYLGVALPTLGFAILLSQRPINHRQMFRLAVKHP